ncbi:MAG: chorismate-binding protein, partial [Campylobacterales bacterium]|nr:chorismate-binding protein [Campylobacterales bacterium]
IMIVDLLRNDLNMVSSNVRVEDFRYVEKINAGDKELLQVSSKIAGDLEENWQENLGDILLTLLPAGSISGTPKKSSVEIIKDVEGYQRGYFCGVFGYFNGDYLDSGVIIRYIENESNELYYKSGGGITADSIAFKEYQEMKDKIYVPVF